MYFTCSTHQSDNCNNEVKYTLRYFLDHPRKWNFLKSTHSIALLFPIFYFLEMTDLANQWFICLKYRRKMLGKVGFTIRKLERAVMAVDNGHRGRA